MRIIVILLFCFVCTRCGAQDTTYSMIAVAKQLHYGLDTTRACFISLKEDIYVRPENGNAVKGKLEKISADGITVDSVFFPFNTIKELGKYSDTRLRTGKAMVEVGAGMLVALGATYLYFFERSKHTDHYSGADDGMLVTLSAGLVVVPVALATIAGGIVRICRHGLRVYSLGKHVSILAYTRKSVARIYN